MPDDRLPWEGEYEPNTMAWVRDQVEKYENSGGREGNTFMNTGLPIIILTTRGKKSGKVRKTPLMRVEHEGEYALVASLGGAPRNPVWYHNLKANPRAGVQDGSEPFVVEAREVTGEEKAAWWERAVAAYPAYAQYQDRTERKIPVFVAKRAG
jgi:deazaflavin-dependent oxidoreductase (nitroreductase family)